MFLKYSLANLLLYFNTIFTSENWHLNDILFEMQCDRRDVLSVSRAYTLMKDLVDSPALSMGFKKTILEKFRI